MTFVKGLWLQSSVQGGLVRLPNESETFQLASKFHAQDDITRTYYHTDNFKVAAWSKAALERVNERKPKDPRFAPRPGHLFI